MPKSLETPMNADATPMNADESDTGNVAPRASTEIANGMDMTLPLPYRRSSAWHRRSSAFPKIFARITRDR
jgi:hypothetical protein